jgi:hypothetical protein
VRGATLLGVPQTVGKLRKHAAPAVRTAASEVVDAWKSVVDRSMGRAGAAAGGDGARPSGAKAK